jgi:hypothetical protein
LSWFVCQLVNVLSSPFLWTWSTKRIQA